MIERIEGSMAVSRLTPSAGRSIARRQKRLKWLSSLREALDEDGVPVAESEGPAEAPAVDPRARISDALTAAEELRGQLSAGAADATAIVSGGTTTAAELAARIAASADRSLRVQAHLSPASVRRLVDGTR